jgi:hypothetical protein
MCYIVFCFVYLHLCLVHNVFYSVLFCLSPPVSCSQFFLWCSVLFISICVLFTMFSIVFCFVYIHLFLVHNVFYSVLFCLSPPVSCSQCVLCIRTVYSWFPLRFYLKIIDSSVLWRTHHTNNCRDSKFSTRQLLHLLVYYFLSYNISWTGGPTYLTTVI